MHENTALILEGGGMRGAFTAGVLDYWLEQGLLFRTVYGVSAGACQACSYLCGQKGRAIRIWLTYCADKRFCSFSSWLRTGDLFNVDFNYHQLPDILEPIDNETYLKSGARFYAVVTNIQTGQAEYMQVLDMKKDVGYVRASSSLPLLSRSVKLGGGLYLDGGASDSIPLRRSMRDGNKKHVLVLTQPAGYRKEPNKAMPLIALRYRKYPDFVNTMRDRHTAYNDTLSLIEAQEKAGNVFVIRPQSPVQVGRIEHDPAKLKALYDMGYSAAAQAYPALSAFLAE